VSYIGHTPFLKEHISIIPHEHVKTHKHYYSYSTTGCDIAWHSPEKLSEGPSRLSDVLRNEITRCISEKMFPELNELESMLGFDQIDVRYDRNHTIERIQEKARYIYKKHKVRLILLLGNREYVEQLREIT
jgi:hypothetical protein